MTNQYVCKLNYKDHTYTVNVFAPNKDKLKEKSIAAAIGFLNELGFMDIDKSNIKPIGYIDKGIWAA